MNCKPSSPDGARIANESVGDWKSARTAYLFFATHSPNPRGACNLHLCALSNNKNDKEDLPMKTPKNIDVLFVAGFGPIVRNPAASRKFYSEALGLLFKEDVNGYLHTGGLDGLKHFALWPLAQ